MDHTHQENTFQNKKHTSTRWRRFLCTKKFFLGTFSIFLYIAIAAFFFFSTQPDAQRVQVTSLNGEDVQTEQVANLSLPFIQNNGQIQEEDVSFYAPIFSGSIFLTKEDLTYAIEKEKTPQEQSLEEEQEIQESEGKKNITDSFEDSMNTRLEKTEIPQETTTRFAFSESFLDYEGNTIPLRAEGIDKAQTKVSSFQGSNPDQWKQDISAYNTISLGEMYNRIDVKLRAYLNNVEKLFFVFPGGNPEEIALKVEGVDTVAVAENGELLLNTPEGQLSMTKPVAYQETEEGAMRYVATNYVVRDNNTYGFEVGAYDTDIPLVIDPLLSSTFLGGAADDRYGYDDFAGYIYTGHPSMVRDSSGNVYVIGHTKSDDFPTTLGVYDETYNDATSILKNDITVSKFNDDLTQLLASTYIGGTSEENGATIALDSNENIYISGFTRSNDFPTTSGVHDTTFNGGNSDGFIAKLSNDLTTLTASTYIGGSDKDFVYSLITDGSDLYIAGDTYSSNFPIRSGAYQSTKNGSNDAFVSQVTNDLTTISESTFLGGSSYDYGRAILKSGTSIIFAGNTQSNDFPTTAGAYDETHNGNTDGFLASLSEDLSILSAATYAGGTLSDVVFSLAKDSNDSFIIAGTTLSSNYPTVSSNYDETHNGNYDGFVSKFNTALTGLQASTYIGGANTEEIYEVVVDASDNIFIAGETRSSDFPTTFDAWSDTLSGTSDGILAKLQNNLFTLNASTYFGGSSNLDYVLSILPDNSGNLYAFGITESSDFPTVAGSYDVTANGSRDMFLSQITDDLRINAYSDHLVLTDSSDNSTQTMLAGGSLSLKITMKDPYGRTNTDFSGDHTVTFSGASDSPHGHIPTCTDKDGNPIDFGMDTTLTFTDGVATCTMLLYKAEVTAIDAQTGVYNSHAEASYDLDMTVNKNTLSHAGTSIDATPSPVSVTDDVTITVSANDAYGNSQGVDGAGQTIALSVTGVNSETPTVTDNTDGTYSATYTTGSSTGTDQITGTINTQVIGYDTDGTGDGTFNEVITNLSLDHFEVRYENPVDTFNDSLSATAGTSYALTIRAVDALSNPVPSYNGSHTVTLSGASMSPYGSIPTCGGTAFGTPKILNFIDGEATCTLILYNQGIESIDVTDGSISSDGSNAYDLDVTVTGTATDHLKITGNTTQTAGSTQTVTLTARDQYGNTKADYTGDHSITFSGANASRDGTNPTATDKNASAIGFTSAATITFASGSATSDMILYARENAEVEISDGTYDSTGSDSYDLDVQVASTGTLDENESFISVSQDPAGTCGLEAVYVTAADQYGNQLESGGDTVVITITGSNPGTPTVNDQSNGLYIAYYSPSSGGTDVITATINGISVGSDDDGVDDGTYNLTVSAGTGNTRTWNGGVSSSWSDANNWDEVLVPDECSTVNIDGSYTNAPVLDLSGGLVTVENINVGLTTASTLEISNGSETNDLNTTGNFHIGGSGTLTHTVNASTQTHRLFVDVLGDMTVDSGGSIDLNGKGYDYDSGPGHSGNIFAGSGHGGYGGDYPSIYYGGSAYGSVTNPTTIGSGGGNTVANGGFGGGALKLTVSGTLDVSGSIQANATGAGSYGRGSGGSVNITAGTITGSGPIEVNGEESAPQGAGSGGRIALYYTTNTHTGDVTAYGGSSALGRPAGAGNIYTKASTATYGDLLIDNNGVDGKETPTISQASLLQQTS